MTGHPGSYEQKAIAEFDDACPIYSALNRPYLGLSPRVIAFIIYHGVFPRVSCSLTFCGCCVQSEKFGISVALNGRAIFLRFDSMRWEFSGARRKGKMKKKKFGVSLLFRAVVGDSVR